MQEKPQYKKFFIGVAITALFTVPIFRSGGRTGLTFFQWVKEHTIFGSPVQYVPEEDYTRELEGVTITREIRLLPGTGSIEQAIDFYQISGESAQELLSHQEV